MTAPVPVRVTRYKDPHCGRTHSSRRRALEHMARCWHNPDARGCLTCKHFEPAAPGEVDTGWPGEEESCAAGVGLDGRPACRGCGGYGWRDNSAGGEVSCTSDTTVGHVGDGREVKPGPIVGCEKWEATA